METKGALWSPMGLYADLYSPMESYGALWSHTQGDRHGVYKSFPESCGLERTCPKLVRTGYLGVSTQISSGGGDTLGAAIAEV